MMNTGPVRPDEIMLHTAVLGMAQRPNNLTTIIGVSLLDSYGRDKAIALADALPRAIAAADTARRRVQAVNACREPVPQAEPADAMPEPWVRDLGRVLRGILLTGLVVFGLGVAFVAANVTMDAVQRQIDAGAVEW